MAPSRTVSRGSVGGASDDAGVEYRRAVAAYAATCGLAGVHVAGLDIPEPDAFVESVALETEGAVDDIEIAFTTGWRASIQAKRSLRRGTSLTKAVAQWVPAGKAGVDPSRERLVIAAGSLNGTMRHLRTALNRRRMAPAGPPTKNEQDILDHVTDLLVDLTTIQRTAVLDAAVVWEIQVEEPDQAGAREAIAHLRSSGVPIPADQATRVWAELRAAAGRLARNRAGANLHGWLRELRKGGIVVEYPGDTPAGDFERQRASLHRYFERLSRESSEIDLRALGAKLPPLPIAGADAVVKVRTDPEDHRDKSDLIWAFLRQGRVVLTALPGGGKSTAMKRVAGDLAFKLQGTLEAGPDNTNYPFPVRASLRDINALPKTTSFRDRMIAVATRDDASTDRHLIQREIDARLNQDEPIALLLDALDETYDDRAEVVSELDNFLGSVPEGVCVIVATRDIAHGQAATLGWTDLRLEAPEQPSASVGPLLEAAAAHLKVPDADREEWVRGRKSWVDSTLAREKVLGETPLTPLLLSVLAIERTPERLPQSRSEVLRDVVTTLVSRRELRRQDGQSLGPLTGSDLDTAATRAFAAEGAAILDHRGFAPTQAASEAIAATLSAHWGLPDGSAETAGRDAVRLFDETGLFVIDQVADVISPRLALFAEVADAINAIRNPSTIADWVAHRVSATQIEPLVLATTLDDAAREAFESAIRADPTNSSLARGAIRARKDGAVLAEDVVDILREQMTASVATGTAEGWADWTTLNDLGIPPAHATQAIAAAARHSPAHATLAEAAIALLNRPPEQIRESPGPVLDVLSIGGLPMSPSASDRKPLYALGTNAPLNDVQLRAAELLLDRYQEALDAIVKLVDGAARGHRKRLLSLLTEHGHEDMVKRIVDESNSSLANFTWLNDYDDSRYAYFLGLLAQAPKAVLSTSEATKLSELADFLETLSLNDGGAQHFYKQSDDYLINISELTCKLYGLDRATIAAQAAICLDRMNAADEDESFACYFSLFDFSTPRIDTDWTAAEDVPSAVDLILRLFWMARGHARLAMCMLWAAEPAKSYAAPLLRGLIDQVKSSPTHERYVAITLVTLRDGHEPESWVTSEDPVLRGVAARAITAIENGEATPAFKKLLFDADGHVREEALANISAHLDPIVDELLAEVALDRPGWMCLSCRTMNPPGFNTGCSGEKCFSSGPRPDEKAKELIGKRLEDHGS